MPEIQFGWRVPDFPVEGSAGQQFIDQIHANLQIVSEHFASAWVADHFVPWARWQAVETDSIECWTTTAFLAAAYPRLTWGTIVLCQSYRNPALLAKMAANLCSLAPGRFVFGIGAGWKADEYHAYNYPFPRAAVRIAQLDEAVTIARLTASVLEGIELRPERFEEIARESFVTAADVADVLALTGQIDYRSAHNVIGRAVRDLVETGEPPSQLTPHRLAVAAVAAIGRPVELDEATLRDALDPAACAAARNQTGSSSEAAMAEMLDAIGAALVAHESWSETAREREAAAETALLARARELA